MALAEHWSSCEPVFFWVLRLVLLEAWLVWRTNCSTLQNSVPSLHCGRYKSDLLRNHIFVLWFHLFQQYNWILSLLQIPWVFECCLWRNSFTWCRRSRWFLQLPPCILNDVFEIFVAWIKRINSPRISGIFQFWFFDSPLLLFSSLSSFSNSRPSVRPLVIWTCRLKFCQSRPRPHPSFWRSFVQ